jgi:hypothetical protein
MGTPSGPLAFLVLLLSVVSFLAALVLATFMGMRGYFRQNARRWARVRLFWLLVLAFILLLLCSDRGPDF